ncbi:MAG TPA: hypothetical protein DCY75_01100 [Clostridiales bacterium]|jgi:hypothetical protein|nr:hypothetical protein [Clostridiales bacterium]
MKRLHFGEWEIEVDVVATKQYYNNFFVANKESQCYRNYKVFCETLTEEESGFFRAFGIQPPCCNVMTIGLTKEKHYPTSGKYCFAGRYIKKPEEIEMTIEQLAEKEFVDDRPDPRVYVGSYQFTFMDPDSLFATIPEGTPDGLLCVEFFLEELPWLLNEKPIEKLYYPPKPWQIVRKINEKVRQKKEEDNWREEIKNQLVQVFNKHQIKYAEMSEYELKEYMNHWFEEIVPKENQKDARDHCFSTRKYNSYLWHAFSYGDVPCIEGEGAKREFNNSKREEAVLILNYEKVGFVLRNTKEITANELDECNDVIITGKNFDWAYVHTHEQQCGPYYYNKRLPD